MTKRERDTVDEREQERPGGPPGTTDAGTRRVDAAPDRRYLVTVPEAGRLLAIGRTRAFRLVNSGYLKSVKIGRSRLVPVSAIEDLVDALILNPDLLSRF